MNNNNLDFTKVNYITIDENNDDQRLDNYLIKLLKGVPKSHIYRIIRGGEIRVNKKRVDAQYRVISDDILRIPPIRVSDSVTEEKQLDTYLPQRLKIKCLNDKIIYEDTYLIAINKPAGLAVHGGTGIKIGLIEQLRLERPELKFLELVHRLDKDTSGILLIAKRRRALVILHEMMKNHKIDKHYVTLAKGKFRNEKQNVKLHLLKYHNADGEAFVKVVDPKDPLAKDSYTVFTRKAVYNLNDYQYFSLLEAKLETGRTHQIRVHLAHLGYPIAGDEKYGDYKFNDALVHQKILKRMFLHAYRLNFEHPIDEGQKLELIAPLPNDLKTTLSQLNKII